jgi:hypothetical protein
MVRSFFGYHDSGKRAAKARRRGHWIGLGAAACALLSAALIPVAAAPAAHGDPIVISCVIGEGCTETPVGGIPVEPPPDHSPILGGPILISCVIGEGCTETPVGGYPGSVFDPQPGGDSGIGLGSPDLGDFSHLPEGLFSW